MSSMSNIHSHKTKQQLINQCDVLQSLANDLSMTIEQKEEILNSLRFANSFLGKRVIALEKLLQIQPGSPIENEAKLVAQAIDIEHDLLKKTNQSQLDNNDDNNNNNNNNYTNNENENQYNDNTNLNDNYAYIDDNNNNDQNNINVGLNDQKYDNNNTNNEMIKTN